MAGLTRAEASRLNGAKSRGPVSSTGRAKAGQNARKHGLNTSVLNDITWAPRVRVVAAALRPRSIQSAALLNYARWYVELERIQLLKKAARQPWSRPMIKDAQDITELAAEISKSLKELSTYATYERKVYSRLRAAEQALWASDAELVGEPQSGAAANLER